LPDSGGEGDRGRPAGKRLSEDHGHRRQNRLVAVSRDALGRDQGLALGPCRRR
jgi:hypothetical protein